jgi:uncharacterized protein YndB with AHSA1/START domain
MPGHLDARHTNHPQDRTKWATSGKSCRQGSNNVHHGGVRATTAITRRIMSNLRQKDFNFSCSSTNGERMLQPPESTPKSWVDPTRETIAMKTKQLMDVRLTRQFSVPPQRVFDAWTDSKTAGKWLFAVGQSSCVEIDARVGGWFYVAGRRNGQKVEYVGEYLDVVRPRRLVFALLAEKYSLNFERVTVELNVRESGCELSLTHATKPEFMQLARRDWANVFARLAVVLAQTGRNAA